MVLHRLHSNNVTIIENRFIDEYMLSANGEFVKIYLYLLRCSSSDMDVSLSTIADALCHTEGDIRRGLTYWEKLHLLHISYDEDGQLTDITFTEPSSSEERASQYAARYASSVSSSEARTDAHKEESEKIHLSLDRKKELSENEDIQQLFYAAQQYLGKQLSPTEMEHILYFYDELHLSIDVIEYLIEYCVSKRIKSISYIKKVAFEWAARGVKTVSDAKSESSAYHKEYYTILKAFGIHNRGPAEAEISYMDHWLNVLGYSMDVILEAINRTITRIHNPSFPYADSILQDWNKKGVHHLKDIAELEKNAAPVSRKTSSRKGSTHNETFGFEPHDYDFQELERQLLDY